MNTKGKNDDEVSAELVEFLHYLENSTDEVADQAESERIRNIHKRVCKVKASEEVGVKYMQAWEERYYDKQEARAEAVKAVVEICQEVGMSKEMTIQKLMQKISVSRQEAEMILIENWKDN